MWYADFIMRENGFGKHLQALRGTRRWSVAQLSQRAGLTESTIYKIEDKDNPQPQLDTITALALALDVSTDELLGHEGPSRADGLEPLGQMVHIPLVTTLEAGDRLDAWTGEVWAVRESTLPQDFEPHTICAFRKLTDAMQPVIQPNDVLLIVLAADITDGQIALLWDPDAERNIVRRAHASGETIIATGDEPGTTPVTLSPDDVLGVVLKIVDRDVR